MTKGLQMATDGPADNRAHERKLHQSRERMTPDEGFPVFWWDSSRLWGFVGGLDDLQTIVERTGYTMAEVLGVKDAGYSAHGAESFGFRSEHRGAQTLGAFLEAAGVELSGDAA